MPRDRGDELSYASDGNKSNSSQASTASTALLKSIQALGKSSKGQRIQILGAEGAKPKYLSGKNFERGYTSTEGQTTLEKNNGGSLNLGKPGKSKLHSDEK